MGQEPDRGFRFVANRVSQLFGADGQFLFLRQTHEKIGSREPFKSISFSVWGVMDRHIFDMTSRNPVLSPTGKYRSSSLSVRMRLCSSVCQKSRDA